MLQFYNEMKQIYFKSYFLKCYSIQSQRKINRQKHFKYFRRDKNLSFISNHKRLQDLNSIFSSKD